MSTDLKGSLPSSIVNQVTSQQALFPVIVSKYIKSSGLEAGVDYGNDIESITNERLIQEVIKRQPIDNRTIYVNSDAVDGDSDEVGVVDSGRNSRAASANAGTDAGERSR